MSVPKSHPRYLSLRTRDRLVEGWKKGLVVTQGLIAHGRGEAFDYLLGEITTDNAREAERASVASMLLAERPVISVNGNVGALSSVEIAQLSNLLDCPVEINIFHRTEERVSRLVSEMEDAGARRVLGENPDASIPDLDHARALCTKKGIHSADVVLVPLEDGDRCRALKKMGKSVLTIDLNPLSRTSGTADITAVDNLIRAIPNMIEMVKGLLEKEEKGSIDRKYLRSIVDSFDNGENLNKSLRIMTEGYLAQE